MKTLGISIVMMLMIGAVATPIGLSYAQMPEQAQQRMAEQAQQHMPEQAKQSLENLESFGVEVSDFVRDAMSAFHDQRQETVAQIKECRMAMAEAEPSERAQVRQDCRASLDEIKESYKDIRGIFQETFKEYRDSIKVLRADAKGMQVSDSDRQAAIDNIRETAKARHLQMQEQDHDGPMFDVEQLRERMMSAHRGQ